jgi:Methylmalonic aciduria and homocystinuria type D protein
MVVEWSIHSPSPFICRHRDRLLPDWTGQISSVMIVLQQAQCDFLNQNWFTEVQKQDLRDRFLYWGQAIVNQLHEQGYLADVFDPKTGYPASSKPGTTRLDDVAVVRACLGYDSIHAHNCRLILHPEWGSAVYPAILVSSAPPTSLQKLVTTAHL